MSSTLYLAYVRRYHCCLVTKERFTTGHSLIEVVIFIALLAQALQHFQGEAGNVFPRPKEISMNFAVIEGSRAGAYSGVREDSRR